MRTYRPLESGPNSSSRIHIPSIKVTVNNPTPIIWEVACGRSTRSKCTFEVAIDEEVEGEWAVVYDVKMPVRETGGGKEKEERGEKRGERFGGHDGDGVR